MTKGAIISDCGLYRYGLERTWDEKKIKLLFIMLNPSTADADNDDATIRRCIKFAEDWNYGGICVGNLYAFRTKKPEFLSQARANGVDLVGKNADAHLFDQSAKCSNVIFAYGSFVPKGKGSIQDVNDHYDRIKAVIKISSTFPMCLGVNRDGTPKHPLYLPKNTKPEAFTFASRI